MVLRLQLLGLGVRGNQKDTNHFGGTPSLADVGREATTYISAVKWGFPTKPQ